MVLECDPKSLHLWGLLPAGQNLCQFAAALELSHGLLDAQRGLLGETKKGRAVRLT